MRCGEPILRRTTATICCQSAKQGVCRSGAHSFGSGVTAGVVTRCDSVVAAHCWDHRSAEISRADSVREQRPSRAQATGGLRLCHLVASRARAEREHQASIERAPTAKEDGLGITVQRRQMRQNVGLGNSRRSWHAFCFCKQRCGLCGETLCRIYLRSFLRLHVRRPIRW